MTNGQAKKLNIALHLNPASQADSAALKALQGWFEQAKQGHDAGGEADLDAAIRTFHHDVYLAGLHLYSINSQLCRQLASTLQQERPSVDVLMQQLQAFGSGAAPEKSRHETADTAVFSDTQLEQLAQLRETAPAAESDAQLSRQLLDQSGLLKELSEELKALRALSEKQYAELQQLKGGVQNAAAPAASSSAAAEEIAVADMEPQIAQMQKIRSKGVF